MKLFRWLLLPDTSEETRSAQAENQELRAEFTQSIMKFERRRSEVAEVADNVMAYMHKGEPR